MRSTLVGEETVRAFYREKLDLIRALESTWASIAAGGGAAAAANLAEADALIQKIETLDRRYADTYGREPFEEAIRAFQSPGADKSGARDDLRRRIDTALRVLDGARSRMQQMKDDLGRRISEMRAGNKIVRHGDFDRTG